MYTREHHRRIIFFAPEECRLATHTVSRIQQMCLTHVYHKTMAAVLLTLEDAIHL